LNFAKKNGSIVNNPISGYEHAKQPKPKKIILDEGYEDGPQWNAIIRNADPDTFPILTCLYETGMRPAEVFLMQWDWIKEKREDAFLIEIPQHLEKTGAIRTIPVSPKLLEVFNKLPRISKYVFPSPVTGEARKGIQRAFDGILKRSGLNNTEITPYALRRTRITIWDAVDSDCCRYVVGHTPKDVHGRNYREFTSERLFKLVGIEFGKKDLFKLISNVG
jgi:integrase